MLGGVTVNDWRRQLKSGQPQSFFNAYVAELRQYRDYDKGLQTGPYNFGFADVSPDFTWVERFSYQFGLLVSYWDTSFENNNTVSHPGGGLILPIDAHPASLYRPNGNPYWATVQSYDSTFSKEPTDSVTLHRDGGVSVFPSLPGVSIFNDANTYWDPATPLAGVIVPVTGTTIRIKSVSAHGSFMQVGVNK